MPGIHRGNELETRRIGDMGIGPRHGDGPGLQGLAQTVEHLGMEFRHYVANAQKMWSYDVLL